MYRNNVVTVIGLKISKLSQSRMTFYVFVENLVVMDFSLGLLAAGLSAATNTTVQFKNVGGVNALLLHRELTATLTKSAGSKNHHEDTVAGALEWEGTFEIHIKPASVEDFPIEVSRSTTIAQVRNKIWSKTKYNSNDYSLWHWQRPLRDDRTLNSYGIKDGDQLKLVLERKGAATVLEVSVEALSPQYDVDFTNVKPELWNFYKRGSETYRRPYGWKRFALNVIGKFENDRWLGLAGSRTSSSSGEWPVSYHGTNKCNAESIADQGYLLSKGKRFKYGEGIYSTPDLQIAQKYAGEFGHEGKEYLIVMQNRVNPKTLKKIKGADKTGMGEYWLNPEQSDVRPYGILIKEKQK